MREAFEVIKWHFYAGEVPAMDGIYLVKRKGWAVEPLPWSNARGAFYWEMPTDVGQVPVVRNCPDVECWCYFPVCDLNNLMGLMTKKTSGRMANEKVVRRNGKA